MNTSMEQAQALLGRMRGTPMRRGTVPAARQPLAAALRETLTGHGVAARLAERIAMQLVLKCDGHLGTREVWAAVAEVLREDERRLLTVIGLTERQVIAILPKLSAAHIEAFLEELRGTDRRIARTILNAAIEAAEPIAAGRRYLEEYRAVAEQLRAVDPSLARTVANATFTAGAPRNKAVELLERFAEVMRRYREDPVTGRMLAKSAFRSTDPLHRAAERLSEYEATVHRLVDGGLPLPAARSLAGLRQPRRTSAGRE